MTKNKLIIIYIKIASRSGSEVVLEHRRKAVTSQCCPKVGALFSLKEKKKKCRINKTSPLENAVVEMNSATVLENFGSLLSPTEGARTLWHLRRRSKFQKNATQPGSGFISPPTFVGHWLRSGGRVGRALTQRCLPNTNMHSTLLSYLLLSRKMLRLHQHTPIITRPVSFPHMNNACD